MYEQEKKIKAIREAVATFSIDKLVVTPQSIIQVLDKIPTKPDSKDMQLRRTLYGKNSR